MSAKTVPNFSYKLHGRHDEISLHITRAEAIKLIQGIRCKLKQRQSKGRREYFILHAHKARIWHRLTVTHHSASRRHGAARLDAAHAAQKWVTA